MRVKIEIETNQLTPATAPDSFHLLQQLMRQYGMELKQIELEPGFDTPALYEALRSVGAPVSIAQDRVKRREKGEWVF
jgi:hypothetical protein